MADAEQLEILRRGPHAWNDWRAHNPGISPNLKHMILTLSERQWGPIHGGPINFKSARLPEASLRFATLLDADLEGADLSGADLVHARLDRANLKKANLRNAVFEHADFADAELSNAILVGADLSNARNLTQRQLDRAVGDASTVLPAELRMPSSWSRPVAPPRGAVKRPDFRSAVLVVGLCFMVIAASLLTLRFLPHAAPLNAVKDEPIITAAPATSPRSDDAKKSQRSVTGLAVIGVATGARERPAAAEATSSAPAAAMRSDVQIGQSVGNLGAAQGAARLDVRVVADLGGSASGPSFSAAINIPSVQASLATPAPQPERSTPPQQKATNATILFKPEPQPESAKSDVPLASLSKTDLAPPIPARKPRAASILGEPKPRPESPRRGVPVASLSEAEPTPPSPDRKPSASETKNSIHAVKPDVPVASLTEAEPTPPIPDRRPSAAEQENHINAVTNAPMATVEKGPKLRGERKVVTTDLNNPAKRTRSVADVLAGGL